MEMDWQSQVHFRTPTECFVLEGEEIFNFGKAAAKIKKIQPTKGP
jgi:ribosomal protein L6P/L9E